jgi:hypothetical protein
MRQFFILLVLLTLIGAAAYGQAPEQVPSFAPTRFDKDQLLNRLSVLKPFQTEKGKTGSGYAFALTSEEFKKSLLFLPPERADEVMKAFGMALAFSFKENTQFLVLTQWRDSEAAKNFMKERDELWRLTDEKYRSYIKNVAYESLDIGEGEKALLTRKTIEQGSQKQDVTTFISAHNAYFFECTLMGNYENNEMTKLIVQIWKIIESEAKKVQH